MACHDTVLAVCVNWNGGGQLIETVRSLTRSDYPRLQIVVVDNASTDGSDRRLEAEFPGLGVWRLERNAGYGAAVNAAVARVAAQPGLAPPDWFLVLNNDVRVGTDMVSELVEATHRHGCGVFGPKVVQAECPDRLEAAWGRFTWDHVAATLVGKNAPAQHPDWNRESHVEVLLGAVLLIHRDVFRQTGGFDPRFFMYHEETDFLYRVRRAGFPVVYCPAAVAEHLGGHSTRDRPDFKTYWTRRNAVLLLRKHGRGRAVWLRYGLTFAASLGWNLATLRTRRLAALWRGARDGFRVTLEPPGEAAN
ncbi:MAG: glycosyltransferase family 2 protein [Acidobacteriota bacterium]